MSSPGRLATGIHFFDGHSLRGDYFPPFSLLPVLILCAALFFPGCTDQYETAANLDSQGTTLVCFGDSITAGYDVPAEQAFPALLADELKIPVINSGVEGDTTARALARLESDVFPYNPRVVIVELGGNDFKARVPLEETIENLDRIVERISSHGAMVLLLEMRTGIFHDPYLNDYKRIARSRGALLVPNFMSGILGSARLTTDGIHPNAEGHELIAKRVLEKLGPLLNAAEKRRAATR